MPALIVAFDGVLADSLPLRARALVEACAAEGHACTPVEADAVVPGRSMHEAALALVPVAAVGDPSLSEVIALRAQRSYRHLVQHGVPLHPEWVQQVREHAARGVRIVLRADSERREVEPLIAMAGFEHLVSVLRCSDDAPRTGQPSLVRSWHAIAERLHGMRIPVTACTVCESSAETAAVAHGVVPHPRVLTATMD